LNHTRRNDSVPPPLPPARGEGPPASRSGLRPRTLPAPPPLPRFALDEVATSADEVASTSERQPVDPLRARRVVRRRPQPDETEEVGIEDILLEAYLEDPPPPSRRPPPLPSGVRRSAPPAYELAPAPPSFAPASSSIAPAPTFVPGWDFAVAPLQEPPSPSVAPVAFSMPPPAFSSQTWPTSGSPGLVSHEASQASHAAAVTHASFSSPPAAPRRRPHASAFLMVAGLVVVLLLAAGAGALSALPSGRVATTMAHAREWASSVAKRPHGPDVPVASPTPVPMPAVAAPPVAAAPVAAAPRAPVLPVVPAAGPEAAGIPSTSVDALPRSRIATGTTLVTFPPHARGHRVYVDGVVVHPGAAPSSLRCGARKIKIGSTGKVRAMDLPCGGEITLR